MERKSVNAKEESNNCLKHFFLQYHFLSTVILNFGRFGTHLRIDELWNLSPENCTCVPLAKVYSKEQNPFGNCSFYLSTHYNMRRHTGRREEGKKKHRKEANRKKAQKCPGSRLKTFPQIQRCFKTQTHPAGAAQWIDHCPMD